MYNYRCLETTLDRQLNNGKLFAYMVSDYGDIVGIPGLLTEWDWWN